MSPDELGRRWVNMEESERSVFEELLRQTRSVASEVGNGRSDDYSARCETTIHKIRCDGGLVFCFFCFFGAHLLVRVQAQNSQV